MILGILIIGIVIGGVYCNFGGFGSGESADSTEFETYAQSVSEITVPDETRIIALGETMKDMQSGMILRGKLMAENVLWILEQEEARGSRRIFLSGHNGHMSQIGSYDNDNKYMGYILAEQIGEASYFAIGTDFYHAKINMPKGEGKRTTFSAYSYDPLAKAAKKCGYEMCWLDFDAIPYTYRIWGSPASLYDGMIFVTEAHPTQIEP